MDCLLGLCGYGVVLSLSAGKKDNIPLLVLPSEKRDT